MIGGLATSAPWVASSCPSGSHPVGAATLGGSTGVLPSVSTSAASVTPATPLPIANPSFPPSAASTVLPIQPTTAPVSSSNASPSDSSSSSSVNVLEIVVPIVAGVVAIASFALWLFMRDKARQRRACIGLVSAPGSAPAAGGWNGSHVIGSDHEKGVGGGSAAPGAYHESYKASPPAAMQQPMQMLPLHPNQSPQMLENPKEGNWMQTTYTAPPMPKHIQAPSAPGDPSLRVQIVVPASLPAQDAVPRVDTLPVGDGRASPTVPPHPTQTTMERRLVAKMERELSRIPSLSVPSSLGIQGSTHSDPTASVASHPSVHAPQPRPPSSETDIDDDGSIVASHHEEHDALDVAAAPPAYTFDAHE
ncbi:hypothetical protein BDK51DRAFT_25512 [Blyttiomyces helicus]|uniref:Uncharacterized protein n=1 Tax=Blyttiomyces helicus TaxID=388810 RepID=A0A4P9WBW2_9FUNG|nr:hypothetical protein BDK51DRAFT_25512 [Blyttiomyces helicus]|eukprot:RKO90119.1 hypothetical protein BDK51DRAFT_25512 [Blyttiomyces helicus]